MATITYRGPGAWGSGYGSALTILQVDTNFYNLNENKLEKGDNLSGLTNKSTARTNLDLGGLPAVTSSGSSNQYLRGDGTWGIPPTNPGTVTRVQGTGTVAGITLTGDFNSSGYLTLGGTLSVSLTSNVSGTLPIANGGTGATTAGGALSNIGAAASTHVHNASDINAGQLSISRMPRGASGYLLQASGTSADPAWVATSGISVNYATSAGSATLANSATNVAWTGVTGKPGVFTPDNHNHTLSSSTGLGVTGILPIANGGTGLSTVGTANRFFASPNGSTGAPSFRAIVASDIPTLNQNTTGNAATATKLATARTINGTSFDGSANITTANWGTSRTITIGETGKSVNGSAGVSWSVSDIFGSRMTIGSDMYVQINEGIKSAYTRSGFSQAKGTFQVTNFFGTQAAPGGAGIYFKNNSSNVAGMLYAAQEACGLVSDNGLNYGAPSHTWFVNTIQEMFLDSGFLRPFTDNGLALGASTFRWNIAYITNGVTTGSDARSKKDIVESNLGLDFILKLNPVSYKWKEDSSKASAELVDRTNFGFIAQEVEESLEGQDFGGLMYDSQTDRYGLRYEQFIAPLTKAIQEQQEIINNLKARIEALEAK